MAEKSGQCLCGAVKFKATPKANEVTICHCGMCRRQMAGPFFAIECGDALTIEDSPALGVYSASDYGERIFCKDCGTSIAWRTKDRTFSEVSVNTLEDIGELELKQEIFVDDKPDYYSFAETTTKLTGAQVMDAFMAQKD